MTREESWQTAGTTHAILKTIADNGYLVSVFRLGPSLFGTIPAMIEMHAVAEGVDDVHVAKVPRDDDEAEYRCACWLAESVGIDLEGHCS